MTVLIHSPVLDSDFMKRSTLHSPNYKKKMKIALLIWGRLTFLVTLERHDYTEYTMNALFCLRCTKMYMKNGYFSSFSIIYPYLFSPLFLGWDESWPLSAQWLQKKPKMTMQMQVSFVTVFVVLLFLNLLSQLHLVRIVNQKASDLLCQN